MGGLLAACLRLHGVRARMDVRLQSVAHHHVLPPMLG